MPAPDKKRANNKRPYNPEQVSAHDDSVRTPWYAVLKSMFVIVVADLATNLVSCMLPQWEGFLESVFTNTKSEVVMGYGWE